MQQVDTGIQSQCEAIIHLSDSTGKDNKSIQSDLASIQSILLALANGLHTIKSLPNNQQSLVPKISDDPCSAANRNMACDANAASAASREGERVSPIVQRQAISFEDVCSFIFEHVLRMISFSIFECLHHLISIYPNLILFLSFTRSVPRPLPGLFPDNIHFEDVLGRVHKLQYEHFKYWQVFKTMLECKFQGLPGSTKVLQGQYKVFNVKFVSTTFYGI